MLNSPIEYIKDGLFIMSKEVEAENNIGELIDNNRYGIIELTIIKELYKYKYLSMNDIKKLLSIRLKPDLQKPKYTSNINMLLIHGHINRAIYKSDEDEGIVIYFLSDVAYEFCKRKYPNKQVTYQGKIVLQDIQEILERVAINQFHIDVLASCEKLIKKETYHGRKRIGKRKIKFASNIEVKLSKTLCQLVPISYGKTDKINELVSELEKLDDICIEERNNIIYPIIICSSLEQIKVAFNRIDACVEAPPQTLFALERDCAIGNVLNKLYAVYKDGKILVMEKCELK